MPKVISGKGATIVIVVPQDWWYRFWLDEPAPGRALWLMDSSGEQPEIYIGNNCEAYERVKDLLDHKGNVEAMLCDELKFWQEYIQANGLDEQARRYLEDLPQVIDAREQAGLDDDKDPATAAVELIASGYEWTCPLCTHENTALEFTTGKPVRCAVCGTNHPVMAAAHAEG